MRCTKTADCATAHTCPLCRNLNNPQGSRTSHRIVGGRRSLRVIGKHGGGSRNLVWRAATPIRITPGGIDIESLIVAWVVGAVFVWTYFFAFKSRFRGLDSRVEVTICIGLLLIGNVLLVVALLRSVR